MYITNPDSYKSAQLTVYKYYFLVFKDQTHTLLNLKTESCVHLHRNAHFLKCAYTCTGTCTFHLLDDVSKSDCIYVCTRTTFFYLSYLSSRLETFPQNVVK